eukprot:TRINITY_DN13514_c0_g1_i5.p1 TRINITY_DN13514_c0_g1~~TRINITY_DN13514_c0_g1_i5.p1  ORF type:complete len:327 (+),score=-6.32 TRINITY_DN13514_c0_g1_i5:110-1090(+)
MAQTSILLLYQPTMPPPPPPPPLQTSEGPFSSGEGSGSAVQFRHHSFSAQAAGVPLTDPRPVAGCWASRADVACGASAAGVACMEEDSVDAEESLLRQHNVRVVGTGRQLLVLSHGFGCTQQAWDGVMARLDLVDSFRVILWDLMGSCSTDPRRYDRRRYSSMCSHADDLAGILDELHVRDAIFVGHSVAGIVGLLASIERPSFFRKLILLNSSPRYTNDASTSYTGGSDAHQLGLLFAEMASDYATWTDGFASLMIGPGEEGPSCDSGSGISSDGSPAQRQFRQWLLRMDPCVAAGMLRATLNMDYRNALKLVGTSDQTLSMLKC